MATHYTGSPSMQNTIKELMTYCPETGKFTHNFTRGGRPKGSEAGCPNSTGYIQISIYGTLHCAHVLAWVYMTGKWPEDQVDHINGDRSDNRWCNLRAASRVLNNQNAEIRSDNTSGVKGVDWNEDRGLWRARVQCNGKRIGRHFKTLEEAENWARSTREQLHGEFAYHG